MTKIKYLTITCLLAFSLACGGKSVTMQSYETMAYSDIVYENTLTTMRQMNDAGDLSDKQVEAILERAELYVNARNVLVSALRIQAAKERGDPLFPIFRDIAKRHGGHIMELMKQRSEKPSTWENYLAAISYRVNETLDDLKALIEENAQ